MSPCLADGERTFVERMPIDGALASRQHQSYVDVLATLGHRVIWVAAAPELADAAFVEDTVVVVDDLAVLTRPGAVSRRAEIEAVRTAITELGLETAQIRPPATLDGGDVLQAGAVTFVGTGRRTNRAGLEQLRRILEPRGRRVAAVPVTGCLHLKSGATALPDGSMLAVRSWLDVTAFAGTASRVIEAPEPEGANLLVSGDRVVVPSAAPATAELVRQLGFEVHLVDLSEFAKAEAGPSCLSVLLHAPD